MCLSRLSHLCLAATVATYLVVPNVTALVPRRGIVRSFMDALGHENPSMGMSEMILLRPQV